jgi:hypothetical protein
MINSKTSISASLNVRAIRQGRRRNKDVPNYDVPEIDAISESQLVMKIAMSWQIKVSGIGKPVLQYSSNEESRRVL